MQHENWRRMQHSLCKLIIRWMNTWVTLNPWQREQEKEKSGKSDGGYQIRSRKYRQRGSKNLSGQWSARRRCSGSEGIKRRNGSGGGGGRKGAYLGGLRLSRREGIGAGDSWTLVWYYSIMLLLTVYLLFFIPPHLRRVVVMWLTFPTPQKSWCDVTHVNIWEFRRNGACRQLYRSLLCLLSSLLLIRHHAWVNAERTCSTWTSTFRNFLGYLKGFFSYLFLLISNLILESEILWWGRKFCFLIERHWRSYWIRIIDLIGREKFCDYFNLIHNKNYSSGYFIIIL